jgi:hypothetical protein
MAGVIDVSHAGLHLGAESVPVADRAGRFGARDREISLLLYCLCWPLDDLSRARIYGASEGVDWNHFLRLSARHRVDSLVENALRQTGVALPASVEAEFRGRARLASVGELAVSAETVRVAKRLDDADIPFRILKGVTVALAAFGRSGLRFSRDIDVLVEPGSVAAALMCLKGAGYFPADADFELSRSYQRQFKDVELVHKESRLIVELHWRLFDNRWLMPQPFAEPSTVIHYARCPLPAFPPDYAFRYLCLHGAHHAWSRLKWIADVNALLASIPNIEEMYAKAIGLGEHRAVGQALLLCHHLFGTRVPSSVLEKARPGSPLDRLLSAALAASLGSGAEEIENTRGATLGKNLSHYALSRDPRYWMTELWFDLNDDREARGGRFGFASRVSRWIYKRYLEPQSVANSRW